MPAIDNTVIISEPNLSIPFKFVYNVLKVTNFSFQVDFLPLPGGPPDFINGSGIIKLQRSNTNVNYEDVPGQSITIDQVGTSLLMGGQPAYKWARLVYTPTVGAVNLLVTVYSRQDTMVES